MERNLRNKNQAMIWKKSIQTNFRLLVQHLLKDSYNYHEHLQSTQF